MPCEITPENKLVPCAGAMKYIPESGPRAKGIKRKTLLNLETCEEDDSFFAINYNGKDLAVAYCPICGVETLSRWRKKDANP